MTQRTLEIVVTCDEGYLGPLRTMLLSLRTNNRAGSIRVWLLHRGIPQVALESLAVFCGHIEIELAPRMVDQALFAHARSSERYPQEMYYRMLAPHVIDANIDRALYLDPDILIINPLTPIFDIELGACVFAAASHTDAIHPATALNNVRLNTSELYFNTGVILMDMPRPRHSSTPTRSLLLPWSTSESCSSPTKTSSTPCIASTHCPSPTRSGITTRGNIPTTSFVPAARQRSTGL